MIFTQARVSSLRLLSKQRMMRKIVILVLLAMAPCCAAQEIAGTLLDEHKEPVICAIVMVFQQNVLKGGNLTDIDGKYSVKPLDSGHYDLMISYLGYDSIRIKNVEVRNGQKSIQNALLTRSKVQPIRYVPSPCRFHPLTGRTY